MYEIPNEQKYPLHHIRPRFKNDIESVLGFVSFGVATIGEKEKKQFDSELNVYLREYPGNFLRAEKTIDNWRTEISSLFAFFYVENGVSHPTQLAIDTANNSNLQLLFRRFISTFQYPGGHLTTNAISMCIKKGVKFHPGRLISSILLYAHTTTPEHAYLTAKELCSCVFNDLNVTCGREPVDSIFSRLKHNREIDIQYDTGSDIIRYARDILDYMVLGNILESADGFYTVNQSSIGIIKLLAESEHFFKGYTNTTNPKEIDALRPEWFKYAVNTGIEFNKQPVPTMVTSVTSAKPKTKVLVSTQDIGERGESLVFGHEQIYLKNQGCEHIIHLIKRIPSHFAVGYDIKSLTTMEDDKFIEVKTTISTKPMAFNRIHLTTNEYRVAESHRENYYIYRLQIEGDAKKLFIINDPVGKYKKGELKMIPRDGADFMFQDCIGEYVELLECSS